MDGARRALAVVVRSRRADIPSGVAAAEKTGPPRDSQRPTAKSTSAQRASSLLSPTDTMSLTLSAFPTYADAAILRTKEEGRDCLE